MLLLRCPFCGHSTPFREGVRFCAGCGQGLGLRACGPCGQSLLPGDRHCACCGALAEGGLEAPLPPAGPWRPAAAPPLPRTGGSLGPAVEGGASAPLLQDFQQLIQEAKGRSHQGQASTAGPAKAHLTQDDIDRLFEEEG